VPVIKRYLSAENLGRADEDLHFLFNFLDHDDFRRELAVEFRRPNELSIYDRGNRLAQLTLLSNGNYRMTTNQKFVEGTPLGDNVKFPGERSRSEVSYTVPAQQLHALLQFAHIKSMRARIKHANYKEELRVAQMIAADNSTGTDVVVIDREVGDSAPELPGQRLDLLALQETDPGSYRFLAIEVKLGNNPELDEEAKAKSGARTAVDQLEGYVAQIDRYFEDYAKCYRNNVDQKLKLGLMDNWDEAPEIMQDTRGLLAVVGYGGIAEPKLKVIAQEHPDLWIKVFDYGLRSRGDVIENLL